MKTKLERLKLQLLQDENAELRLRLKRITEADVCSFGMSRDWKHKRCGDDTGKGFDCNNCEDTEYLQSLGIKLDRR